MPGPPKTPTAILKLRGSKRAKGRAADEPDMDVVRPVPPADFSDAERAAWDWAVDRLFEMGVTGHVDAAVLTRYAQMRVRYDKAHAVLRQEGETYQINDQQGNPKCIMPRPEVAICSRLSDQMLKIEQQYGMTAATRPNIKARKKPAGDPMADLLSRRKQSG